MEFQLTNGDNESVWQHFWEMKGSELFLDVELFAEKKSIKAHRLILALRSPILKEKMAGENEKHELFFRNVSFRPLRSVINLCYIGQLRVGESQAAECQELLEELQIDFTTREIEIEKQQIVKKKTEVRRHTIHESNSKQLDELLRGSRTEQIKAGNDDLAMIRNAAGEKVNSVKPPDGPQSFPCENFEICQRVLKSKGGRTLHQKKCSQMLGITDEPPVAPNTGKRRHTMHAGPSRRISRLE